MKITKSIKMHAVDLNKNQALCGMVQNLKPNEMKEGFYLDVNCKSCQWIINKELTSRYQNSDKKVEYTINKNSHSII